MNLAWVFSLFGFRCGGLLLSKNFGRSYRGTGFSLTSLQERFLFDLFLGDFFGLLIHTYCSAIELIRLGLSTLSLFLLWPWHLRCFVFCVVAYNWQIIARLALNFRLERSGSTWSSTWLLFKRFSIILVLLLLALLWWHNQRLFTSKKLSFWLAFLWIIFKLSWVLTF